MVYCILMLVSAAVAHQFYLPTIETPLRSHCYLFKDYACAFRPGLKMFIAVLSGKYVQTYEHYLALSLTRRGRHPPRFKLRPQELSVDAYTSTTTDRSPL